MPIGNRQSPLILLESGISYSERKRRFALLLRSHPLGTACAPAAIAALLIRSAECEALAASERRCRAEQEQAGRMGARGLSMAHDYVCPKEDS
jgi:hypothetical protein